MHENYVNVPILRGFERIEKLFNLVQGFGYIAGGYCLYMCSPRKEPAEARDVDVFTKSAEAYAIIRQKLKENLKVKHESDISITFQTKNVEEWKDCPMINLIKPVKKNLLLTYGEKIEDVLENFDFSICKVGAISDKECLAWWEFLEDERYGRIRILKMESPVACMIRLCKYAKKGYRIPASQIMDIFQKWDERGQEYKDKLYKALDNLRNGTGKVEKVSINLWPFDNSFDNSTIHRDTEGTSSFEDQSRLDKVVAKQDDELNDIEVESINLYELIRIG